ncbi:SM-20-related protein [Thiothrix eikelboomii]|uniref:SM-20-related protein n=1 Tax=Thiothrix eikelboomii TaxID=92487 RepID=A0A1T4VWJ9_9GAMM|nr:2OG-Fe(II) oxygenase [Thiothrix eikelboomii]SKA69390.1 SM-20-related protein [Thiothrix eikelboomii]
MFKFKDQTDLIEALATQAWVVIPEFLKAEQVLQLRTQALSQYAAGRFKPAAVGQGSRQAVHADIRRDAVLWLEDHETGVASEFLNWLADLRLALNQALFLGLVETELHFAVYPSGGFYRKHIDNFRGSSARLITVILYLNQAWQPQEGGELRLYLDDRTLDIAPEPGKLVLFLSERFEHEVLPTQQERLSLTGWLRRRS